MSKHIIHKVYQYAAVFEPCDALGGFTATIPSLPGCISEGDTFEEALKNIQEAASLYLEVVKKSKEDIQEKDQKKQRSKITTSQFISQHA